jgi:aminoglycoside phosphotransferase (APT) family kinase protein
MGEVWKVDTGRGVWAVKALFPWGVYDPMPPDVEVQLAAAAAGIALPRPVVHRDVAVVTVSSRQYRAYEWVELDPPVQPPATAERAHEAGHILGAIHELGLPADSDVDRWYTATPEASAFGELADAADAAGMGWSGAMRAASPVVRSLLAFVTAEHAPPVVCHRDFDVSNVLPARGSTSLITLDWENVGPLAPDQELASALLAWCTASGTVDQTAVAAFLAGYASGGGDAVVRGSSFSMAVCTCLNFLHVMAEQSLEQDEHQAFADAQVEQLLASSLADLLDGIRDLAPLLV